MGGRSPSIERADDLGIAPDANFVPYLVQYSQLIQPFMHSLKMPVIQATRVNLPLVSVGSGTRTK